MKTASMKWARFAAPALGLVALAGCAASGASTPVSSPATSQPTGQPTPPSSTPQPVALTGMYDVTGTNPDQSPYSASLEVKRQGSVYQFHWVSGPTGFDGVGVVVDQTVGVAFTQGNDGSGCRVAQYKVTGATLNGLWGQWGLTNSGTETAKRLSGTSLVGTYDVTGTNLDGSPYTSKLAVTAEGAGFAFSWDGGKDKGFGIQRGDYVSVGIGGPQCGFVAYELQADGTLEGKWGDNKARAVGTERAKKK
jgi:hypothetical protein